jgi:SAM-dependent methyltransferase
MKTEFATYFADPLTKRKLGLSVENRENDQVITGCLRSKAGRSFPIINGIPRFTVLVKDKMQKATARTFAHKWKAIPSFGKEHETRDFYNDWYLQRYGFSTEKKFQAFLKTKKFILDAGTGLGRDASWYAKLTKGIVFGLDIADSINLAPLHIEPMDNLCFVQGDLSHLPFEKGFFDFIACDQVIHHTRSSRDSFAHLAQHLADRGSIAVYVYKKKAPVREFCDDYLRRYTTACSEKECWEISEALTDVGRQLSALGRKIHIRKDIPVLGIAQGSYDIQRFFYWHFLKCFWNSRFTRKINVSHNYDWYRPLYAHRHSPDEVKAWFKENNIVVDHFDICDAGISALGHKIKRKTR